ncbi:MAG TPA: ABC transporter permease subunit, partial [Gaiellaceae bacterium]|nr:ABC transporter permease subunit [Gaiellaceae bacterium]
MVHPAERPHVRDRVVGRRAVQLSGYTEAPGARGRIAILRQPRERAATALSLGFASTFLIVVVALPIAALVWQSKHAGWSGFWTAVSAREPVAALKLTLVVAALAALTNAVFGTLTAWVLVRDEFRGKAAINAVIDLPFALPTIVAGLTLLALYGKGSPVGIDIAYTRWAILLALLFVTLPFVIRSVQPVLIEFDPEMEEAAASLGASARQSFVRIVLPNLWPAIVSGAALAFAR